MHGETIKKLSECCLERAIGGRRNSDLRGRRCGYSGYTASIVDELDMSVGH